MPYILVRNIMNLQLPDRTWTRTYIDCQDYQIEGRSILGDALLSVGASLVTGKAVPVSSTGNQLPARPIPCTYYTTSPPQVVLDLLELQGYKVVFVSVYQTSACIWSLHKPA